MANIFNSVSLKKPNKTTFNKSYKEKYSTNLGLLYPIFFEEVVPGSHVKLTSDHFVRFQPMLAPIFDSVHYKQYYFYVPYRLICSQNKSDSWDNFRTGGLEQIFPSFRYSGVPYIAYDNFIDELNGTWDDAADSRKFFNSFELPFGFISALSGSSGSLSHDYSALPFFAYWKIIIDYFIDEQLDSDYRRIFEEFLNQNEDISLQDLIYYDSDVNFHNFFRKRYKKDYFTSATQNPQLGNPINLPLNTGLELSTDDDFTFMSVALSSVFPAHTNYEDLGIGTNSGIFQELNGNWTQIGLDGHVYADDIGRGFALKLSDLLERINIENNTLFSVRDLRNSFIMQEMLERNNVAGYRYFEWIKAHFGVSSPDARLQRSEFLGSSDDIINFVEVTQTSVGADADDTPLGYLAGKGIGGGANAIFNKTFPEDGIIIGLACYVPDNNYYQGIPKRFLRQNGLDYLMPIFERVGEQAIVNEELCFNGNSRDSETFGYTSRYADYKSHTNIEKGDFVDTLKYWTLSRDLAGYGLSSEFLQINYEDFDDIFAVMKDLAGTDKILCVQNFNLLHTLPLSRYSTPAKI